MIYILSNKDLIMNKFNMLMLATLIMGLAMS